MKLHKAYKFRLSPTDDQKKSLAQQGGNCRWLWNHFLDLNQEEHAKSGKFIFAHDLIVSLPELKKEYEWLGNSFSQSLQQVARHFDRALKDSFKKSKGFPQFKKKAKCRDSFTIPQKFRVEKNYVFIPKVGEVPWAKHRAIKGKIKHLTVTQDGNQWYCSVCVELKVKKPSAVPNPEKIVGIDVGLKTYATLSDGTKIENPKVLAQYQKQLSRANRRLHKREKGSKNREKQRLVVAKLHRKIRNVRRDFQHKTTSSMIAKYDGFVLEDLNIKGMLKNHCLAKAISDAGWHEHKRQLRYKSEWAGKPCMDIDRFEPSSKTGSCCGWYNPDLKLSDREFVCQGCGTVTGRDLNAAINIRNFGLKAVPWVKKNDTYADM
jgi:putative transposase